MSQTIPRLNFADVDDIPASLRQVADDIEAGVVPSQDTCIILVAGVEQPVAVFGLGPERSTEDILATLSKGQHCVLNAVMPYGSEP